MPSGIILLDKPKGLSSNGALQRVRKAYRAASAGHVGTLDPMATGMLPLCLDEATKVIAEIESGAKLSGADIAQAMVRQGQVMERMRSFQEKYAFTLCAVNQVPPFDAKLDWPHQIEGVKMENYVAWMKSAYWITATFCPAISVPAGFTPEGLPVGIQIVGRHRDDLGVLQVAHAFEQATGVGRKRPAVTLS